MPPRPARVALVVERLVLQCRLRYFRRVAVCAACTVVATLLAYAYVTHMHNLQTTGELMEAAGVMASPRVNSRCRAVDGGYRCLPNVLLIGASKCGTTSLAQHLGAHPSVGFVRRRIDLPGVHEVHRFDRPSYAYAIHAVDLADEWASAPVLPNRSQPVIHYTPQYLYAPTVPFEMRSFYPHPERLKFIVMVRDPVMRAQSSYWFKNSHLFDSRRKDRGSVLDFTSHIYESIRERKEYEACRDRNRDLGELHKLQVCFGSKLRSPELGWRHVDKGVYVDQLERWFLNYPRENFLVKTLEEFHEAPAEHFRDVCDFLGVGTVGPGAFNSSEQVLQMLTKSFLKSPNRSKQPLPDKVLQDLRDFYRPYNERLERLLGRRLGWSV
mmetsp:Transcript_8985/g.30655  ORF Transcript_8985/g.30655 Transcript_8985/m.30655 type:complete len:382 (+) Transcript_8985:2-1147(+)